MAGHEIDSKHDIGKSSALDVARSPSSTNSTKNPTTEHIETNEHDHLTLWESIKKWKRIVYFSLGITSGILMYGYDYVIVGTVSAMPSFQRDFGRLLNDEWILPSLWLGLWNFISPGCSMAGAIAGGYFQDRFGRRSSLALGSFLSAVGVAICFASNKPTHIDTRRGLFFAGKGFQGGAIGMVMATAQTYLSEILPPNLRGPLLAFFPIFTLLGQVLGALVIFACLKQENGYVIAFATQWPLSVLPVIMAFVVPESPTYFIRKGRDEDALKAQRRFDGPGEDNLKASRETLARIKANIEHEKLMARATYQDSFKQGNLRRTLIVMFAAVIPQLFGLTLLAKASYFVQIVGMDADLSVIILILGIVVGLIANVCSLYFVNRWGRRVLIMGSLAIATLFWGSMGVAGIWKGGVVVWYTAAMMIAVIVVCGLGAWPCSYAVGSEVSALDLRAKAQGIGWFTAGAMNSIFGFVLPYIFNPDQGNLRAKTGFVFAGLCILGVVITFFYVPEMKGRTPAEIDHMFELGLSARKFKGWKNPSASTERENVQEDSKGEEV